MRLELADDLEKFVRDGDLWHPDQLQAMIDMLQAQGEEDGDPLPPTLARQFAALQMRLKIGGVDQRFAEDVEGVVYPRLWKLMEALRDGMPEGELRIRIEVMNRRLARVFAEEPEYDE